jgi:chromosome segregation ATPase
MDSADFVFLLQSLRRFAREKSELLRRNALNWAALGRTRAELIQTQGEVTRLTALAEERESQRLSLASELTAARAAVDQAQAEAARLSRDFEDARAQSLEVLEEARRERDQAREEAKKQSGMTDTLTSRVEALVAELEAERKESTLLRQTASINDRALESWKEKCKGMPFPDLLLVGV